MCTGVDISPVAIEQARQLSESSRVQAERKTVARRSPGSLPGPHLKRAERADRSRDRNSSHERISIQPLQLLLGFGRTRAWTLLPSASRTRRSDRLQHSGAEDSSDPAARMNVWDKRRDAQPGGPSLRPRKRAIWRPVQHSRLRSCSCWIPAPSPVPGDMALEPTDRRHSSGRPYRSAVRCRLRQRRFAEVSQQRGRTHVPSQWSRYRPDSCRLWV
jgi:hypothetical protein